MKKSSSRNNEEIKRFNPSIQDGLKADEIEYMKSVGKVNIAKSPTNKSYGRIIFDNVFTLLEFF